MITRWSRSTPNFYALIGQNLTGEFMRKIYAPSWNLFTLTAEADRVLCQLVMFLPVFFHWMYKLKYSYYQESSVIHGWFVYWVFVWEIRRLSKSEIRFRMASFSFFHLVWCGRELKSLKRFWPHLIASKSYISNGKPESGADPGFFSGGGALVSCSTSTPINYLVFFLFAKYQLY